MAQSLKYIDSDNPQKTYEYIMNMSDNKVLPKSVKTEVSKAEVENVLSVL